MPYGGEIAQKEKKLAEIETELQEIKNKHTSDLEQQISTKKEEIEKLEGKRVKGVGKITCVMNAEGEVHPTLIKFGEFPHHTIWTLEEFLNSGEIFDGRNKNEVIFKGGVEV